MRQRSRRPRRRNQTKQSSTDEDGEADNQPLMFDDMRAYIDGALGGILDELAAIKQQQQQSKPAETPEQPKGKTSVEQRLAEVEELLRQKEEKEQAMLRQERYNKHVGELLSPYSRDLLHPDETRRIIDAFLGQDLEEVAGTFRTKDGKPMSDQVKAFFESPFGKHLLKAPALDGSDNRNNTAHLPNGGSAGKGLAGLFNLA